MTSELCSLLTPRMLNNLLPVEMISTFRRRAKLFYPHSLVTFLMPPHLPSLPSHLPRAVTTATCRPVCGVCRVHRHTSYLTAHHTAEQVKRRGTRPRSRRLSVWVMLLHESDEEEERSGGKTTSPLGGEVGYQSLSRALRLARIQAGTLFVLSVLFVLFFNLVFSFFKFIFYIIFIVFIICIIVLFVLFVLFELFLLFILFLLFVVFVMFVLFVLFLLFILFVLFFLFYLYYLYYLFFLYYLYYWSHSSPLLTLSGHRGATRHVEGLIINYFLI